MLLKVLDYDVGALRKMFIEKKSKGERDLSLTRVVFGICSVNDNK